MCWGDVDGKQQHQIATGTGLGLGVISIFFPFVFTKVNPYISEAGLAIGSLLFLWGMWPLLKPSNWSRMIPLNDACRQALEAVDGSILSMTARRPGSAPNGPLCFVASNLFTNGMVIYGKQVPSSKLLPISNDLLFANDFAKDATVVEDKYSHRITYIDLMVKRRDLAPRFRCCNCNFSGKTSCVFRVI